MRAVAVGAFVLIFGTLPARAEVPAVHALVNGQVEIGKNCGKTAFSDLKLLVSAERAIDYRRPQVVPLGPDGRFAVSLHHSYNYRFVLMSGSAQVGSGRYEARYPEKPPRITAHCKEPAAEAKAGGKPAH